MRELQNKNRDFKGIWIPKEIWLNTELTLLEKIILIEIDSLDGEQGCYANNQHFADFCDISKSRASQVINQLKDKKYIKVDIIMNDKKQVEKRIIKVNGFKKLKGVSQEIKGGVSAKTKGGYVENCEDKNTSFKNTSLEDIYSASNNAQQLPSDKIEEELFERLWKLYPLKRGKGQISKSKKKEIAVVGEEQFTRCIKRYKQSVEKERQQGFKDLRYMNGSTFFNSGYVDFLDIEVSDTKKQPPVKVQIVDGGYV